METNDLDFEFSEITVNDDSFDCDVCSKKSSTKRYRPSPKRLLPSLKPIDFEEYVRNNCQEKIKILNRITFHHSTRPIVIFFNHFREKCAYHTKCLDKLYQLALKYGESIEFIAADMLDIDVMNSKWHSIDLFCRMGNPEKVSALIYAIDEEKRIHEHLSGNKSLDSLSNLCENLLKGKLFITQPLPKSNNHSLVKICVQQNYKQLVTDSTKYVLLIVSLDDYFEAGNDCELNYEFIAEELLPYNIDVVHINAEENYVPFELGISYYPSLTLIPPDNKTQFLDPIIGPYKQENIVNCIKSFFKDPKIFLDQSQINLSKNSYQPLNINPEFNLDFQNLQQYLQDNCQHYLKVFERQAFQRTNRYIIIAFMNFQNGKYLTCHHLNWIDKIYQVAINLSSPREYFIADFKDIDIINPQWKSQDFIEHTLTEKSNTPKVFGIDLNKNKFLLKDFKNAASLFYFAYSLTNGELYISEPWPNISDGNLIKTCIADSLNLSITLMEKNILLAIYYSNTENSDKFLKILEEIALSMQTFDLKVMKIDSRLNCIPLELDNSMYPIMYFIPQSNKNKRICYTSDHFSKQEIAEFIKQNIEENK